MRQKVSLGRRGRTVRSTHLAASFAALLQLAQHPESVRGEPHIGIVPEARLRTEISGLAVVCTAAQHAQTALPGLPSRAVRRRAAIIVIPAILHPFGGVAGGVEQTKAVGLERANRKRL